MISCAPLTEAGDNKFLIVGGYERGSTLIQVVKENGKYVAKELFVQNEFGDQTKPAIFIDGHFYAQYGTNNRRDGLCCMDLNGNVLWKTKRAPNFDKGSMIYVDGLLLATDGADALYLIDPSPEGYKQLAKADLLKSDIATEGRGNWAPLALADGMLLIRNHSKMMCVKVTK
jgi:outer membrane protein assembly factor BamB